MILHQHCCDQKHQHYVCFDIGMQISRPHPAPQKHKPAETINQCVCVLIQVCACLHVCSQRPEEDIDYPTLYSKCLLQYQG